MLRQPWVQTGLFAAYWLAELIIQAAYTPPAGSAQLPPAILILPAIFAVVCSIWSERSWTNPHRKNPPPPPPPASTTLAKVDATLIRTELAHLGRKRVAGEMPEEAFLLALDALLSTITNPAQTPQASEHQPDDSTGPRDNQ